MAVISEEELQGLVGTRFPGGRYTIEPYVNWLTCDCVRAPEMVGATTAHPLFFYMATLGGIGLPLEELFELCGSSSEDGPMFGEWGMQAHEPLRMDTEYVVSGGITGVQRKDGKKTGIFDIVEFELELREVAVPGDPGHLVAVTRSSFIYPRRD